MMDLRYLFIESMDLFIVYAIIFEDIPLQIYVRANFSLPVSSVSFSKYPNVFFRIIAATVSGFIVPDYQCLPLCLEARENHHHENVYVSGFVYVQRCALMIGIYDHIGVLDSDRYIE